MLNKFIRLFIMQKTTVMLFILVLIKSVTSLIFLSSGSELAPQNKKLRICVPKDQKVDEVERGCVILGIEDSGVECFQGNNRLDCLRLIKNGTADFGVFNPEELVSHAAEDFTIVGELRTTNQPFQRYVVAVVDQTVLASRPGRLNAVLKDRVLCHPGVDLDGKNSDYSRTLNGYLEYLLQQPSQCSTDERKIKTLAEYFGRSCRAGPWVADRDLDNVLKRQYSSLCAACGSGTCSAKDRYWGALGALACVVEVGEVAWADITDVKSFFSDTFLRLLSTRKGEQLTPNKYALLCPDYTSQTIANTTDSCVWLHQPWPAIVTRSTKFLSVDKLIKLLMSPGKDDGFWHSALTTVLGVTSSTLTPLEYPVSALDYLSKARGFRDAHSMQTCKEEEVRRIFKCYDGKEILYYKICNGVKDCTDGSDERFRTCHNNTCPANSFRCAYGGCVDEGAACNGVIDCHDGSDESDDLCQFADTKSDLPPKMYPCLLPPYPDHGTYIVNGYPDAVPGQGFDSIQYTVMCDPGYDIFDQNKKRIICFGGVWSDEPGPCVRYCRLKKDPSLEYHCVVDGEVVGIRKCNDIEPTGTEVRPVCKIPNNNSTVNLRNMNCLNDGTWDYIASCSPDCGVIPGDPGASVKRRQVPWHAVIYKKNESSYHRDHQIEGTIEQICGGSLISPKLVISAARCFFGFGKMLHEPSLPDYYVALGKFDRAWQSPGDDGVQRSGVSDLRVPPGFQGFTHDVALVTLSQEIQYGPHITPVCVDFNIELEYRQLEDGIPGVIASWGAPKRDGSPSQRLKVLHMPFTSAEECFKYCQGYYKVFVETAKICAGSASGPALFDSDNGSGLSFPAPYGNKTRHYLRGVAATLVSDRATCNLGWLNTFTQLSRHAMFVREHIYN